MESIALANKHYDKGSLMLDGFDIALDNISKPIHVDLSNYLPENKTNSEIKQIREDIYSTYQNAMAGHYPSKENILAAIAKSFPDGISWRSPDQDGGKCINTDVLYMQGRPDSSLINTNGYGEAFLKLHQWKASSQLYKAKAEREPSIGNTTLAEAMFIINQSGNLSDEQMQSLNRLIAEDINLRLIRKQEHELA